MIRQSIKIGFCALVFGTCILAESYAFALVCNNDDLVKFNSMRQTGPAHANTVMLPAMNGQIPFVAGFIVTGKFAYERGGLVQVQNVITGGLPDALTYKFQGPLNDQ